MAAQAERDEPPQKRPRRGRISRARILQAALELVDREGLDALSMRRLGAELGVEAMALYRHAPSKDALLSGLVETVLARVPIAPDADDWAGELHRVAHAYRRVMLAHPNVFPLAATRPLSVPLARRPEAALALGEQLLQLLHHAGFGDREAADAYRSFVSLLLGHLFLELWAVVEDPGDPEPAVRLGLHRLPAHEYPLLRRAAPFLARLDHDRAFERDLGRLLEDLKARAVATVPRG